MSFIIFTSWVVGSVIGMRDLEKFPVDNNLPVNDPLYKKQLPYLQAIGVPDAWKRLVSTPVKREKVTVAVIDSGVQSDHPDLVANVIKGYNVIDHNDDTHDRNGHGTKMAGVLGATLNNSIGLAGVIDLVKIMPIFDGKPVLSTATTDAVDYVIRNRKEFNIKIILMATTFEREDKALTDKVKEATEAGVLIVVPAGNDGENISVRKRYPCAFTEKLKGVLCVAATEKAEAKLMKESNFGNYVDIAAPGRDIIATGKNSEYTSVYGTSPASAILAGVAAMLYSLVPNLAPGDVKKILKDTAKVRVKDSSGKITFPFGRVDAGQAVAKLIPG
ncbi:Suppressor of the cold-sensitive snRNP bioproteinsis mutant brr1-1 [Perkinsus chesapeaki]|uniref:subtilisin n=1 Tax=Perkinsus chesapeaki TaxID=330153 RepID=A0A7J6MMZ6_PERCH|nr:Suppressor of the cold-sensitive snRNP bioproteinsis mutant brr1-1 [Perkinsus chesapeaki]